MALRVQLVILASAFVAGNTLWWVSCLPHVVLRAQLFVKVGARPRTLSFRTHCLGHGPSVMCGVRLSERRECFSLVHGQSPSWYGVWCPPPCSQLFVKMGARAPVPYGVGDTISDILTVNPDDAGLSSGAGTNLKASRLVRREAPENFFLSCPSTYLALQVQSVVLVSASVWSVQFDHFLVFFVLLTLGAPVPWMESASLSCYSSHPKAS